MAREFLGVLRPLPLLSIRKEQFTAFCLSLLPWIGSLVFRDGVTFPCTRAAPLREQERAPEHHL